MNVVRPSRFYVARVYFRRFLRWRRNSSPYISGDAFADLADFVYKPPKYRAFKRQQIPINNARTIFCRSEDLSEMIKLHGERISAKVIICGNSDFEFHEIPKNLPVSIKALFLQNSFISDNEFIFSIPIGIENLRWGVNGNPWLFWTRTKKARHKVLFGPFGNTHKVRSEVAVTFSGMDSTWDFLDSRRISPVKYASIARGYRFVAAVRGNGIDTHRHWESLYRGIIPVVKKDPWSDSIVRHGIPFVLINEWTPEEIHKVIGQGSTNMDPTILPALWMPYWTRIIDSKLQVLAT